MTPFKAPVEDILFSLNRVAGANGLPLWDADLCAEILNHFATFAEDKIAPLDEPGDKQGCVLTDGQVSMPDGFSEAYSLLAEGGWQGLTAPEAYGGMAQNPLVAAAVSEVFAGANHSLQMVCNLVPGAISTLLRFGTEVQQQSWIPRLASGDTLSTMCLTEPGAGSDLSRIRAKARQRGDGWIINGEKIFISGGDQNLSNNILHLVLARTGHSDSGVKGLSLFLCNKLLASSAIRVDRIEEKLGLHASPTCHLVFNNAPAELIGEEGAGLTAMFTVMNHARIDVALQGVAHAARAHAISSRYAAERVQGRNADGSDATLVQHADVRRMLNEQRCLTLGARAMAHTTLVQISQGNNQALADFLTPLCKVFCTEAGIKAADIGIQVLGGYGYLSEYRVSQTWRDARITSIYEGANAIHELATATRGLRVEGGAGADAFSAFINELSANQEVHDALITWQEARRQVEDSTNPDELAHDFTQLTCDVFYRAVWARIAEIKADALHTQLRHVVFSSPLPILRTGIA